MRSLILFRNASIAAYSLLALFACSLLSYFFVILPSDVANYHKRCQVKKELTKGKSSRKQTSTGVQKDVWLMEEGGRMHHTIQSKTSLITFHPTGNHYEVTETMDDISGEMQESVKASGETVRLFTAKEGVYDYGKSELFAKEVGLRICAREKEGDKTVLIGTAETMMFCLKDHKPRIAAEKLKASLP